MKIKIADIMIKAMSQTLADGDTVLHGLGSPLPALAMHLAKASHASALVFFPVSEGLDPDTDRYRLRFSSADPDHFVGATAVIELIETFDL